MVIRVLLLVRNINGALFLWSSKTALAGEAPAANNIISKEEAEPVFQDVVMAVFPVEVVSN
ncbi:hypothetical protein SDC9_176389 [bioreactor metagenome]|uniref:Uncharacterized protein n=1 Tax=bioreactor metagenome TaxID=1076179 RepID=A0A645GZ95_9ZZZZ